ncbi:MAG: biopolymer transporter ExbD [Elusimicrobia bacterium]|nr:biopolymer transporter ExbD [Elusimicrobiota bacterium]
MRTPAPRRAFAELNLIPLIDISLILVIIFMVLTPILVQSQLTVKLPKAATGSAAAPDATVKVLLSRTGAVLVEGQPVKWNRLERELILRLPKSGQKTVLVQADRSVPIEKVVAVMDAAKRLGAGKLGIGVAQEDAAPAGP